MTDITHRLFADGGIVGENPSSIGCTWAFRLMEGDKVVQEDSAFESVQYMQINPVGNNCSEFLAVFHGLCVLPDDWKGVIFTDSANTIGRMYNGWKLKEGLPEWLIDGWKEQRKRLIHYDSFTWVLMDGHPTRAQLVQGVGKRGHPVSPHQVWCDEKCQEHAKKRIILLKKGLILATQ